MPGQTIEAPMPGRAIERGVHKDRDKSKSRGKGKDRATSKGRDRGKSKGKEGDKSKDRGRGKSDHARDAQRRYRSPLSASMIRISACCRKLPGGCGASWTHGW
jgi:hypothetical protein